MADLESVVFRSSGAYESDGRALFLAEQELIRRCMVRHGFAYRGASLLPPRPATRTPPPGDGYGLYRAFARLDASRPAVLRAAREPATHPQARYLRRLSARERAAYGRAMDGSGGETRSVRRPGLPRFTYRTGGCHAAALQRLHGSLREHYSLITAQNAVGAVVAEGLARDASLVRSLEAWRRCMASRGFRHRSPREARDELYAAYVTRRSPRSVRARELATATADRACVRVSRLDEEQLRAERAAVVHLSDEDKRMMLRLNRRRAAAAERARAIMASVR